MLRRRLVAFPVVLILAWIVQQHAASAQTDNTSAETKSLSAVSASEVLAQMDDSRGMIRRLLEQARQQRDVIKTLCVDDKLNQTDIALRSARGRRAAIEEALRTNNTDLAARERTGLDVLHQRTSELAGEAQQCVSKEVDKQTIGPAAILGSVDPNVADDPAYYPPGIIIIEPPPSGSAIK